MKQMFGQDSDQQNQLMRMAVEASPNGMVMVDSNGMIMLVNSSVEKLFGYSRDELIGQSIELLVPDSASSQHPSMRQSYFASPVPRAMGHGRELYALHKDGFEFPVEIGLNPIESEGETFVLAAVVDITERLRAQEMMRLAVEAAPNGMIMTDSRGRITLVNTFAEELFGYDREELVGRAITELVPDRFKEHHPQLREAYFEHPVSRAMGKGRDLYGRKKNGEDIAVEIGLNPIKTLQGTMILASVVDITERKVQEQELKAALAEKEVLLSEIHHRVKNNLQIIDSLIGMQLDSLVSEQAISVLKDSQNRVKSMALIHQTLYQSQDFSRVDVSLVMQHLLSNLRLSYAAEHVDIDLDIIEIYLPLDASIPLGLIVNELVSNTLKHAFIGIENPAVRIALNYTGNDRHELCLRVSDNGMGLPESVSIENAESLGLRLVAALTRQLSGKLELHYVNPTEFIVTFAV